MTPNDFSNLAAATAAPTTSRLRRRNHTGGPSGFDRKAFIAQLTQADGGLDGGRGWGGVIRPGGLGYHGAALVGLAVTQRVRGQARELRG